jgi:hypothetical protein
MWNANSTGGWGPWVPAGGSGAPAGSTAAPASVPATTMTVVPLPATSQAPAPAAPPPASSAPAAGGYGSAVEGVENVNAAAASSCSSTTTTTTTEWVTMTVSPPAGAVGGAPTIAPVVSSVSTANAVSLIATSSVAAGGFFQYSSISFPGAASSAAMSVPTTFATSQVASSAASSAAVPSSTGGTSPSTGGQRGLSYNEASLTNAFAGQGMTWAYNWGNSPGGTILSGLEFVPMLWGLNSVSGWNAAAKSAIASGSTHLLSFNEPDLPTQSNIDPSTAATNHITYMNPLSGNGVQIGSPAITNSASTSPPQGIAWLTEFFTACAGNCKVDFVAFHWYATASSFAYFQQQVQDVISAAAAAGVSKVWLTEFQASGTDAEVEAFMAQALPFLDSTPAVERYAYFMCATGAGDLVDSSSSLSAIGQAYAA